MPTKRITVDLLDLHNTPASRPLNHTGSSGRALFDKIVSSIVCMDCCLWWGLVRRPSKVDDYRVMWKGLCDFL